MPARSSSIDSENGAIWAPASVSVRTGPHAPLLTPSAMKLDPSGCKPVGVARIQKSDVRYRDTLNGAVGPSCRSRRISGRLVRA